MSDQEQNESENSRVVNTILEAEDTSSHSQQHSVRNSGKVEERKISVINTDQPHEIRQRVTECVSQPALRPPGSVPVLQYEDLIEEHSYSMMHVYNPFSFQAMNPTLVYREDDEEENNSDVSESTETASDGGDSREREDELRIVLLGKTGVGKSSTGNTILGREVFISDISEETVTKVCQKVKTEINGRHITVIDTPGLFDTQHSNEVIQREITNCISMILPGPHVFIIVINLGQRFTKEEKTAVKIIQETFAEKSLMYTMVLFSRGDDLKKKTIEQYLGKPGSALNQLIEACGNRYHVFNNNETEDRTQVTDLLQKIDNMVKENGDSYYSCKMFREMEREKQEKEKKILIERAYKESLKNHEKEKKRREEEFREKSKNAELNKLIRFLAFNNRETQNQSQVIKLLNKIKKNNKGRYFTNEMFKKAEISIDQRSEMIKQKKTQNQAQIEELKARYYKLKIKSMRKGLKEKKQKRDEERERLKNKCREQEQTLRREFEKKEESDQKKRETEDKKQAEEEIQQRDEYKKRIEEMKRRKRKELYEEYLELKNKRKKCEGEGEVKQMIEKETEKQKRERTEEERILSGDKSD